MKIESYFCDRCRQVIKTVPISLRVYTGEESNGIEYVDQIAIHEVCPRCAEWLLAKQFGSEGDLVKNQTLHQEMQAHVREMEGK
jgi:hypothetical protein